MDRAKRRRTAKLDRIQVGAKIKHQDKPYPPAPGCCFVATWGVWARMPLPFLVQPKEAVRPRAQVAGLGAARAWVRKCDLIALECQSRVRSGTC